MKNILEVNIGCTQIPTVRHLKILEVVLHIVLKFAKQAEGNSKGETEQ